MTVTQDDLFLIIGLQRVDIYALQKQIVELQKRIEELTPKVEEKCP